MRDCERELVAWFGGSKRGEKDGEKKEEGGAGIVG